jgi:hypothetical protein
VEDHRLKSRIRERRDEALEKRLDGRMLFCIIPPPRGFLPGVSQRKENTMKRAVRMLILMVGLACTYVAIATPILNAELGPMPLCNPANPNCSKR